MRERRLGQRGFTLMEAVATLVILSIATPPAVTMLQESAGARQDATLAMRGRWLAIATLEQVLADVHSDSAGRGFDALEDSASYLEDGSDGLYARMDETRQFYSSFGVTCDVQISQLVGFDGVESGEPDQDVYRYVQVVATWTRSDGEQAEASVGGLVTDL